MVGLCSQMLGETALTQHKFDGLQGAPGTVGRLAELPVDVYWPGHQLVVRECAVEGAVGQERLGPARRTAGQPQGGPGSGWGYSRSRHRARLSSRSRCAGRSCRKASNPRPRTASSRSGNHPRSAA